MMIFAATSTYSSLRAYALCYSRTPMIGHVRGVITKGTPGDASVDVGGVGYRVHLPLPDWDQVHDGASRQIWVTTYVREDRFELFGFLEQATRTLFEELIARPGIGPRIALELCAVPRSLLLQAINEQDSALLSTVKGIGRKTAEKLLVELKGLAEKHPDIFLRPDGTREKGVGYDQDTIAALTQLGFATPDILRILPNLPKNLKTTEERVTAALRSL